MSTAKMGLAKQAKAASSATALKPESNSEYRSLSKLFHELERLYKLGDVDKPIKTSKEASPTALQDGKDFEEKLIDLERLIHKYEKRLLAEQPSLYFKAIAIEAEAKDYFDTATPAYRLDLYIRAQELLRELPPTVAPGEEGKESEERKTIKNKIRVIIAGLEYLHTTSEFGSAIALAESLYKYVISSGLMTKKNPAFGSRAIIAYFLGRSHRQRGIDDDYQKAIDYFYQCSEYYFEMARRDENKMEDVVYARTRAMVSLAFGAGFLFYMAQSDLAHAKGLIAQARLAFLKDNKNISCELHYYYLELLYASILRAEAGEMPSEHADRDEVSAAELSHTKEKLDRAMGILEECDEPLQRKPNYYVHLLYNKALVYVYQGTEYYQAARDCITSLIEKCQGNPRWLANALILKSHLERRVGDAETALSDALRAYNQAGNHLPVRIEALLASGQAQLARKNFSGASADIEKAYRLNDGANKKLDALTLILLAEIALEQHYTHLAFQWITQAKAIMPSIKHGFILHKFHKLEKVINEFQTDFVIASDVEDLSYDTHETALRRWLLDKALREDNSLMRAAQRLNVSKKTIYQWRDTYLK